MNCDCQPDGEKNGRAKYKCALCDRTSWYPDARALCKVATTYVAFLDVGKYLWQCRACNWTLVADSPEPVLHSCGGRSIGLGDRIEHALEVMGITKDRWVAFKSAMGMPPLCRCPERREWLNRIGESFGIGVRDGLKQALRMKE